MKLFTQLLKGNEMAGVLLYMDIDKDKRYEKEDDLMSALAQYLETNRERAYAFATANTKRNEKGRPIISKDDEWVNESEWDDLFELLKNIGSKQTCA